MLAAAKAMPLLGHYPRGRPFDIMESDVARWLCDQREIRQFIFNYVKRHGAICYEDGRWVGAQTYVDANRSASSRTCERVNTAD
jgi:hypothetical protein